VPVLVPVGAVLFREEVVRVFSQTGLRPRYLVYTIAIVGLVLGWRFNRNRVVFATLLVLLAFQVSALMGGSWRTIPGETIHASSILLAILMPLNFIGISFLRERGVLTVGGAVVAVLLLAQAVFVYQFGRGHWAGDLEPMFSRLAAVQGLRAWELPRISQIVAILAGLVFAVRLAIWRSTIDSGLLAAMALSVLALPYAGSPENLAVFFGTAVLALQLMLLQDSYARVYIDELTGLRARRALDEQLMRLGRRYTIAMVDIDHFKQFNDHYGHEVGDQALRYVAAHLERTGGGGRAFRYGGEEFTLLFPRKAMEDVLPVVEAVRERIASQTFAVRGKSRPAKKPKVKTKSESSIRVPLTVSIGVAQPQAGKDTADQVIQLADEQLYRAKRGGRNRVEPRRA
jgi:diguanylate cyclase (GGDEF)-like protein